MSIELIIGCLALLISIIALIVSFVTFIQDHRRRKKQSTIEFYTSIATELYPLDVRTNVALGGMDPTLENLTANAGLLADTTRLLSSYERLSVGVNSGIFDFDLINRMAGSYLIVVYDRFAPYINNIRNQSSRKKSYVEFENLVMKIRTSRSSYENKGRM